MTSSSLIKDYIGYGVLASRPATPPTGSGVAARYYATDTTTDYLWNGSAWVAVAAGGGGGGSTAGVPKLAPPLASQFPTTLASFRGGSAANAVTVTDDADLGMVFVDNTADTIYVKPFGRAIPAGSTTAFEHKARINWTGLNAGNDQAGIFVGNPSTGNFLFLGLFVNGDLKVQRASTSASAWSDGTFSSRCVNNQPIRNGFKIVISGTTITTYDSMDLKNWNVFLTDTGQPAMTHYGFYTGTYGGSNHTMTVPYFSSTEFSHAPY